MSTAPDLPIWTRFRAMGVGILLMLFNSPAGAASLGQVMDWCSNRGDEGDQRLCVAYVSAAIELMRSSDPVSNGGHHVCVPDKDLNTVAIPMLTTWMEKNPQARNQEPLPTAGAVLAGRYPCP